MNKTNTANTEILLRALGLIALVLVILASGMSTFRNLLNRQELLYIIISAAVLLGAANYMRHKRLNAAEEEE